ncbi:ABC transporter permease [Crossiella sp. CA198]|uniref:ABC transporter permease n=1 Tax=Crossiella sp. CA198 TaxID=3455607 RepID=UPI003F8CF48C
MTGMRAAVLLGLTELKLLLRKKINAASVLGVPVAMCVVAYSNDRPDTAAGWGSMFAHSFMIVLLVSTFLVSTTVFTARRQSLVLKRMRTAEITDAALIAGMVTPLIVVTLAQMLGYLAFCVAIGAPLPENPLLALGGILLGAAIALLAGAATASLSSSVEVTQITAMPLLVAALGGMIATFADSDLARTLGMLMPLNGPTDMLAKGWGGGGAGIQLPEIALILPAGIALSAVVLGVITVRFYKWEPR